MPNSPQVLAASQCRAARALIEWSQDQLSRACAVDVRTIADFEGRVRAPDIDTKRRMRTAFEEAGVAFIAENGGGPGVRLRFNRKDVCAIERLEGEGGIVGEDDL